MTLDNDGRWYHFTTISDDLKHRTLTMLMAYKKSHSELYNKALTVTKMRTGVFNDGDIESAFLGDIVVKVNRYVLSNTPYISIIHDVAIHLAITQFIQEYVCEYEKDMDRISSLNETDNSMINYHLSN